MHLILKNVQFLHFLTWNKSPLSVYNIPYFSMFVYFFFFKRLKNVHFLIKIHIFGRNALNCALYLEFNAFVLLTQSSILFLFLLEVLRFFCCIHPLMIEYLFPFPFECLLKYLLIYRFR